MAICTRMCMVMWPSSFRTVPPLICLRQHGKMHKKAYNFGMWYTSGTLRQNKSPETLIFSMVSRLFAIIQTRSLPVVFLCNHT